MKVLFVTSEAQPFAASGGLADVSGSLPQALRRRLIGTRIVMPLYDEIPQNLKDEMRFITSLSVPVAWRRQYCGVFEARWGGVIYYFLDNQYYFKRSGLYGHYDDAERFAFFSRAVLEMLPFIDFKPDIIHCNDWQTALVPTYYSLFYGQNQWYQGIKTIFTIHNIQYQGKYGTELYEEVVGIPPHQRSVLDWDGCINFMKGAIETANRVTTVSPSYAWEIRDPWFSHGLDPILNARSWKLCGILNGIDTDSYNPETDIQIYNNFSVDDLSGKAENKRKLQERLSLEQNPDVPIIAMVTRLVSHKGLDLVKAALDQMMREEYIQFVILGSGDWEYESFFQSMQDRYPGRLCACHGFIPELSRKIYAGADMFLMPSKAEPCGLSQMIALRYGTIPIVREVGGLRDSIQDSASGDGNGFTFKNYDAMDMLGAVRRAIAGYWQRDGWNVLVKRAMTWVSVMPIHYYHVVGRRLPTENDPEPEIFRMRLFAPNPVTAKSRYWYFMHRLQKMKKGTGEILAVNEIFEKSGEVKNYGIWLRYNSRSGTHNMYKEYRDTSLIGAVRQCYSEMAGTHRARDRSIQIIKTAVVADEDLRRHQNIMYTHKNVKYALPHRQYRAESKKFRSTFLATRPSTCRR